VDSVISRSVRCGQFCAKTGREERDNAAMSGIGSVILGHAAAISVMFTPLNEKEGQLRRLKSVRLRRARRSRHSIVTGVAMRFAICRLPSDECQCMAMRLQMLGSKASTRSSPHWDLPSTTRVCKIDEGGETWRLRVVYVLRTGMRSKELCRSMDKV
jgi:hypothetical protein